MTTPEPAPTSHERSRIRSSLLRHPLLARDVLSSAAFIVGALGIAWSLTLSFALSADEIAADAAVVLPADADGEVQPTIADAGEITAALPASAVASSTTSQSSATTAPLGTFRSSTVHSGNLAADLERRSVHILGDSLTLSAADELRSVLGPDISIDAETGLGLYFASGRVAKAAVDPDIVVVSLGTNDFNEPAIFIESLAASLDQLEGANCVVWVDTQPFQPELIEMNIGILAEAEQRGRHVAGWSVLSGEQFPERHAADGYHLSAIGQTVFADLIGATIESACLG